VRFLGIGETNDLGDMYLRLRARGHEVKVFMSDENSAGVMEGMLEFTSNWRNELSWIRSAGKDGFILFETAADGSIQDQLRSEGYHVIGGSSLGDRLEGDRAYGQRILNELGIPTARTYLFESFEKAMDFVQSTPRRYVMKLNGTIWSSTSTYTGEMETGEDMIAMLRATRNRWPAEESVRSSMDRNF
jgi:phosphoribosylamine--glycine ligase